MKQTSLSNYEEIEGNLITLAKAGHFQVIAHGCNCWCKMKRGLAPQMAEAFGCDTFSMEALEHTGDMNKLGTINYKLIERVDPCPLYVVNAYTQFHWDTNTKPFDYEAFTLCARKMNHRFGGLHIGLPQIGSHLAGGDWDLIKIIIQKEFKDCPVTVVIFKQ